MLHINELRSLLLMRRHGRLVGCVADDGAHGGVNRDGVEVLPVTC